MGINVYPTPSSGGGIKLVQRGNAASAGTITITAVDITKAFVNVYGTASSGTVAASGTVAGVTASSNSYRVRSTYNTATDLVNIETYIPSSTISGGTTTLVAAVVQGYLSSSTQLVVSGPCRWEVVEFA